jgi:hypothetical protein
VTAHTPCPHTHVIMQDGARAEMEGVTFTGHTELGAAPDAPAISRMLKPEAVCVFSAYLRAKGMKQVERASPRTSAGCCTCGNVLHQPAML